MRYIIEYSQDENEVCVIPQPDISFDDFNVLIKLFGKKGYRWWLPADERCGYRFAKEKR